MTKRLDYNEIPWEDIVYYDETSPTFLRWKVDMFNGEYYKRPLVSCGDIAGGLETAGFHGYSTLSYKYKKWRIQNIVWILHTKRFDIDMFIDHVDGDRSNNNISNLREVTRAVNNRNHKKQSNNKTGVTGVLYREIKGKRYYVAIWNELTGLMKSKAFSVEKYGDELAFKFACEKRSYEIQKLNEQGAGYTVRHGL